MNTPAHGKFSVFNFDLYNIIKDVNDVKQDTGNSAVTSKRFLKVTAVRPASCECLISAYNNGKVKIASCFEVLLQKGCISCL